MLQSLNIPPDLRDRSVGKKLRFDVFERDGFTCQYCGAQPPGAVLECDHITPLAKGGKSISENLITACQDCNRGKSDRHLGSIGPRPDADLMYLRTMQEIAELKQFQAAAKQRSEVCAEVCKVIAERAWALTDDAWAPMDSVLLQMLDRYSPQVVDEAVSIVAKKIDDGIIPLITDRWLPFLWGTARHIDSLL